MHLAGAVIDAEGADIAIDALHHRGISDALAAQDLHALMERSPRVAQHIKDVVEKRVGRERVSAEGDIVTEEIK